MENRSSGNARASTALINLPDGEVIEMAELPHEGWGSEPGKWYLLVRFDADDNEVWRRSWIIPRE